jgi:DNA-directed RNA polymerase specialized sigma24 family protein
MKALAAALGQLDEEDRELLSRSMRDGAPDEEIAATLSIDASDVALRRAELLDRLAAELDLDGREQRDELFATLQDLPPQLWHASG